MEDVSLNSEPLFEDDGDECEIKGDYATTESDGQDSVSQGKREPIPPALGMEFASYDDAYKFYNSYAKELGFGIRVKNSSFGAKSKERYKAVLCCSCEGFKRKREARQSRPETRTGCPAMIRIKLMDSKRWGVIEFRLEHNHLISPASAQLYRSHKNMDTGTNKRLQPDCDSGIQTNRLNQTVAVDAMDYENLIVGTRDVRNYVDPYKQLRLKEGDAHAIYNFFCRMQLTNPNFFYLMDINDEGRLRNVFWADARSRAAYGYFNDVVAFDTTYLNNRYVIPFTPFVGVNHHGQSVLFGCGLLASETVESFIWLFRAWLTCMSGRPPSVIITDQCNAVQKAVAEVFPRARHRLCLWHIMQRVPEKLSALPEYKEVKKALEKAVYDSLRVDEFETAWHDMTERYKVGDHEWLKTLYEDRKKWVLVFLKDTFFAGMSIIRQSENIETFFDGYVHKNTSLKEFVEKYELALQKKHQKESKADLESRSSIPVLKTKSSFELQLSNVYTNEIFKKFQWEVEEMSCCFNISQIHVNGPIVTYVVRERVKGEGTMRDIIDYEVLYNTAEVEVHCICNLFNFKGYLCRHALSVLNYNGVEGISSQYILSRWRKDFKRIYVPDYGSENIDVRNPVLRYDHLYKRAIQFVETGAISQERYRVALLALEESANKVRLVEDNEV